MDIELLSKIVKEVILDNDEVTLPGVGSFVAEVVPSTFSDKGYTINPPYRRLSFRQREATDTLLVDLYASSNGLDRDTATSIVVRFLAEMKETLMQKKTIVFPELGRLRATRENHFFFVPDEDLSIYPDGFGLEPVSLKTHVETEDDVAAAVSSIQLLLNPTAPVVEPEPVAEPASVSLAEKEPEPMAEPEVAPEPVTEPEPAPVAAVEPVVEAVPGPESAAEPVVAEVAVPAPEVVVVEEAVMEPAPEPEPSALEPEVVPEVPVEPEPEVEVVAEPAPAAAAAAHEEPKQEKRGLPMALKVFIALIVTAIVLLGIFILLAHIAPDFIDSILYTPEELEIINHR